MLLSLVYFVLRGNAPSIGQRRPVLVDNLRDDELRSIKNDVSTVLRDQILKALVERGGGWVGSRSPSTRSWWLTRETALGPTKSKRSVRPPLDPRPAPSASSPSEFDAPL